MLRPITPLADGGAPSIPAALRLAAITVQPLRGSTAKRAPCGCVAPGMRMGSSAQAGSALAAPGATSEAAAIPRCALPLADAGMTVEAGGIRLSMV